MLGTKYVIPYIVLLALVGVAPSPAAAQVRTSAEDASRFVQDLGNRTTTLLAEHPDGAAPELQMQLRDIIHDTFDLNLISRFALGSTWDTATLAQRREYQELFALSTGDNYARLLGTQRGGSLTVLGSELGLDSADAVVRTQINRPDGTSMVAHLRLRDSKGRMRIIDATMGGASLDVAQRDEFTAVIQRKGLDGLIGDLTARVDGLRIESAQRQAYRSSAFAPTERHRPSHPSQEFKS